MNKTSIIILLIFWAANFLFAQNPVAISYELGIETHYYEDPGCTPANDIRGPGTYHFCKDRYYIEEKYYGLPHGPTKLFVAPDNSIWTVDDINTRGLCRFDGNHWTTYNQENSGVIPPNYTARNSLVFDSSGVLWYSLNYEYPPFSGRYEYYLVKFDGYRAEYMKMSDSLACLTGQISDLDISPDGVIWGTTDSCLFSYDGVKVRAFRDSLFTGSYRNLALDTLGNVWVATSKVAIQYFDGSNWITYDSTNANLDYNPSQYTYLFVDHSNDLWIYNGKIIHFNGSQWMVHDSSNSPITYASINRDPMGGVWAFAGLGQESNKTVYKFDGSSWNVVIDSLDKVIGGYAIDSNETIWAITYDTIFTGSSIYQKALLSHDGFDKMVYETLEKDIPDKVSAVFVDSNRIIASGEYSAGIYDGNSWTNYSFYSNIARSIAPYNFMVTDKQGNLWAGVESGSAYIAIFDGNEWTLNSYADIGLSQAGSLSTTAMYRDENGDIWIANEDEDFKLLKYDGSNWIIYNTSNSNISWRDINSIASDSRGDLWMGTTNGFQHFDGTDFYFYQTNNSGIPSNWVRSVAVDIYDNVWFETYDGIAKFNRSEWFVFDSENTPIFPDAGNMERLQGIMADPYGNVWLGSGYVWSQNIGYGLYKYDGYEWRLYNSKNSPLWYDDVSIKTIDEKGNIWVRNTAPDLDRNLLVKFMPDANPKPALKGIVYYDADSSGVRGLNEIGVPGQKIMLLPDSTITFSNQIGVYHFDVDTGKTYTVKLLPDSNWYLNSSPGSFVVSVDSMNQISRGNDFGLLPLVDAYQCEVFLTGGGRCGETGQYFLSFKNSGTVYVNGNLFLWLDSSISYSSATQVPAFVTDSIGWYFTGLAPGETRTIRVYAQMPGVSFIGDTLDFAYAMQVANGGQFVASSRKGDSRILRCAYDPNDKLVYPDGLEGNNYTLLNEAIEYTIRFQNTGNDTAINIEIKDTLDPGLDLYSLVPLAVSHPVQTTLESNGVLTFTFDDIFLPDSTINEPASHGFITFRIKPKPGIQHLTTIENNAHIYFDFNPPIATNTAVSTIVECDSIAHLHLSHHELCSGDTLIAGYTKLGPANIEWYLGGANLGNSDTVVIPGHTGGTYDLHLEARLRECTKILNDVVKFGPVANVEASGPTEFCTGGAVMLTSDSVSGNQWYRNGTVIADSTLQSIQINTAGEYYVELTSGGCSSFSDSITVTVNPLPGVDLLDFPVFCEEDAPFLLVNGSPAGGTYNGTGVNGPSFSPASAGIGSHLITYIYTDSNGCTDSISKNVLVEVCTGLNAPLSGYFNLYPNPIQNSLNLEFVTTRSGKVELMNLMGEKVKEVPFQHVRLLKVDMTGIQKGLYFLNVIMGREVVTLKLIKE